jgi:adenylyl- and sulfurtransferase ThiI
MKAALEQTLISKIRTLSDQQVAEVENFVEFLVAKSTKRAALDRLLAIAPALEAAKAESLSEEDIAAEVKAARVARRGKTGDVTADH